MGEKMSFERLRRVTDLFVEGTELHVGDDESGPVMIWVNKLNPFQAQEALKDAQARRFLAIGALRASGEYDGMIAEVGLLPSDKLAAEYVEMLHNEIYLDALNDLDLDEKLNEQREAIERGVELVTEEGPDADVFEDVTKTWFTHLRETQERLTKERLEEAKQMDRAALEEEFLEKWREFNTRSEFEREHRITQIYYSMRRCEATRNEEGWNHRGCDHSRRILDERNEVKDLPDELIEKVLTALDGLAVPVRAAGNSDAPTSSSDSSGPSKLPEAASTPSSPAEAPNAAPTT